MVIYSDNLYYSNKLSLGQKCSNKIDNKMKLIYNNRMNK